MTGPAARCRRLAWLACAAVALVAASGMATPFADPASDAPETRTVATATFEDAASYAEALAAWRTAEELNGWIGARFEYDPVRAMRLSESQRGAGNAPPIARPEEFFAAPRGICVDLARFAVETLRAIDPDSQPVYLMIEFAPVSIGGNTLRRHWLAGFRREGVLYFFADSKRPGHLAGPYATTREFVEAYEEYRGRQVVAHRVVASWQRTARTPAGKVVREARQ